jgi:hypothetical protein
MRPIVIGILISVGMAGTVSAHPIGLYTDQVGITQNCTGSPPAGTPYAVYVVHKFNATGTKGSRFKVAGLNPAPAGTVYLGYTMLNGFINPGSPDAGISCAYGFCDLAQDIGVLSLNFFVTGVIPTCSELAVVADPLELTASVVIADCNDVVLPASGGGFAFFPSPSCDPCSLADATKESTWGKVKSLYR